MGLISLIEHTAPLVAAQKTSAFYAAARDAFVGGFPKGTRDWRLVMARAVLTIASKNYGAWSLRGWLLCKLAGLDFEEKQAATDDPSIKAELLLLSPSFLVPCLEHDGIKIWDTLAIAEFLN